jgi:hypothetical protein
MKTGKMGPILVLCRLPRRKYPKLNLFFLHRLSRLCYNLSENALLPIRPAVDRRALTKLKLMVPGGVEAEGGKNKEVFPLWQSCP